MGMMGSIPYFLGHAGFISSTVFLTVVPDSGLCKIYIINPSCDTTGPERSSDPAPPKASGPKTPRHG